MAKLCKNRDAIEIADNSDWIRLVSSENLNLAGKFSFLSRSSGNCKKVFDAVFMCFSES